MEVIRESTNTLSRKSYRSHLQKNFEEQTCTRCVMDTSIPEIRFDEKGVCQFCHIHDILEAKYPIHNEKVRQETLEKLVDKIRQAGKGKDYDCVVGTSGGRDSTWTMYTAKQLGLRPLAVHFDNGWNSETAVTNIQNATQKLNIDLETIVADWEEFRDLQISFLKASVPDVEVPTDVAIHRVLHLIAGKENIKYVLNGHSFRTEGVAPIGWTYIDGKYINAIHKQFGNRPLKDFKNFTIPDLIYYTFYKGIKVVPILNYSEYDQEHVDKVIKQECGWEYYGGHHHESYYTKFIQSYLLPKKFNIDKRKTEFSALIRSGQKTREEALKYLESHPYEYDPELIDYTISKFEISRQEWDEWYSRPPKSFLDYPSYYPMMKMLKYPIKVACDMGVLPELLYLKYLG